MALKAGLITCAGITVLFLGGLAVLIAFLADHPKSPAFSVASATVSHLNFTANNRLNATFYLHITAHNRDSKYSIIYHFIVVSVYHSGYTLAYQSISPFTQLHGSTTVFSAHPAAQNVVVSDPDVARVLRNETRAGLLDLEVRVRAAVRFEAKRWKHRHYTLKVVCDPVLIGTHPGNKFQETSCNVDRY